MNKEKRTDALTKAKRKILQSELLLGNVLINITNGICYNDSKGNQVKINIGKNRKGRDYSFSHPEYWRVLNWYEALLVKSGLYKLVKVEYQKENKDFRLSAIRKY